MAPIGGNIMGLVLAPDVADLGVIDQQAGQPLGQRPAVTAPPRPKLQHDRPRHPVDLLPGWYPLFARRLILSYATRLLGSVLILALSPCGGDSETICIIRYAFLGNTP